MEKELSLDEMLERWGLRVTGGTLKNPMRTSTGGEAVLDDDLFLVAYVEAAEGFDRAAPILHHCYSAGRDPGEYRIRMPGEPLARALIRLGWFDLSELAEPVIARRVLRDFRRVLADRMRAAPYRPPSVVVIEPAGGAEVKVSAGRVKQSER